MNESAGNPTPSLPMERSSEISSLKMLVNGASAADLEMATGDEVAERADLPSAQTSSGVRRHEILTRRL